MTSTALIALVAGVCAAAAIVELAGGLADRRRSVRALTTSPRLLATLARVGRPLGVHRAPADLPTRLEAAGAPLPLAEVMAAKGGAAVTGLLAAAAFGPGLPGRLSLVAFAALPLGAFVVPDAWILRRTRERARRMESELADVLDLLRVAVGAGLTTARAMAEVGRRHPGLLAGELRRAASAIELGVPRGAALRRLSGRCPVAGVSALVAAVERADRHGAPLARTLAALAAEARAQRARAAAEAAARAAPKIQLVVALLLVPSVLLLVAAALLPAVLPT